MLISFANSGCNSLYGLMGLAKNMKRLEQRRSWRMAAIAPGSAHKAQKCKTSYKIFLLAM